MNAPEDYDFPPVAKPGAAASATRLVDWITGQRLVLAHGAVIAALFCWAWLGGRYGNLVGLLMGGLFPAQVCLVAAWAAWSNESEARRWSGALWRLALVYLAFLLWRIVVSQRPEGHMPWSAVVMLVSFATAAWSPAWIFRWFGWRLVPSSAVSQGPSRWQFRLTDIAKWATLLCVILGVASRFHYDPRNVNYMWMTIWFVWAVPIGVVSVLLCWSVLHPKATAMRVIVNGALAVSLVSLAGFALLGFAIATQSGAGLGIMLGLTISALSILVVWLTAGAWRWSGWQLERGPGWRVLWRDTD